MPLVLDAGKRSPVASRPFARAPYKTCPNQCYGNGAAGCAHWNEVESYRFDNGECIIGGVRETVEGTFRGQQPALSGPTADLARVSSRN